MHNSKIPFKFQACNDSTPKRTSSNSCFSLKESSSDFLSDSWAFLSSATNYFCRFLIYDDDDDFFFLMRTNSQNTYAQMQSHGQHGKNICHKPSQSLYKVSDLSPLQICGLSSDKHISLVDSISSLKALIYVQQMDELSTDPHLTKAELLKGIRGKKHNASPRNF